jgi:ABC-type uncharacterized transport system permease subunit
MDKVMELIFVVAGHLVNAIGGLLAILLIGLLPIYAYTYVIYRKNVNIFSSRSAVLSLLAAMALSFCLSAVFAMSAIVLNAWG